MATKKQLINLLTTKNDQLSTKQVLEITDVIIKYLSSALINGQRIEIRGFGAFSIRKRNSPYIRNPQTNKIIQTTSMNRIYYRPSKNIF